MSVEVLQGNLGIFTPVILFLYTEHILLKLVHSLGIDDKLICIVGSCDRRRVMVHVAAEASRIARKPVRAWVLGHVGKYGANGS
jgi:hypothetical protein